MAFFKRRLAAILILLAMLAAWALLAGFELVDRIILPSPWAVFSALPGMVDSGFLVSHVAATLGRVGAALLIACLVGLPLGLFLGYRREIYGAVEGPLHALRSIPASALFPLFLIIIGVGEFSIIALAAYPSLLVILVNAVTGASLANEHRLHQARILGLNGVRLITDVLFFEALPSILAGIRTAVSYSLVLVVAVEMFIGVGRFGLGRVIYDYQSTYRIPETYAAIIIAGSIGIALNRILSVVDHRLLAWIPEARHES